MSNPDYSIVENRGSSIDPESSGPFPPNRDDRQRDVFLDQDDRLRGRLAEPEQITEDFAPPQAFDISPPPPMPILESSEPIDIAEMAADAARSAINDAIRNMTINGVSPDISGGTISFDIPTEPSASTAFAAMNAEPNINPPLPETPAIIPTPLTPSLSVPNIQEQEVISPTETEEVKTDQGGEAQKTQDIQNEPLIFDPETVESKAPKQAPARPSNQEEDSTTDTSETEVSEDDQEIEKDNKNVFEGGLEAYKERQKGEMRGEYEERINNLKDVMRDEGAARAIGEGDMSYLNSGYVPVLFTRKDGQRKILVQLDNSFAAVVEGAVSGERTTQLPSSNAYYEAGGGSIDVLGPWDLEVTNISQNQQPNWQVKIRAGTLNGILPSNWNQVYNPSNSGLYYAKAKITTDAEQITGVSIVFNTTPPTQQSPKKFAIDTDIEYLFGLFSGGQKYRTISNGHITLSPQVWFTLSADPPANVGESIYSLYYTLQ